MPRAVRVLADQIPRYEVRSVVDIWQFYADVETLIVDLRAMGETESAVEVETAIRGGSTSGEILGRLRAALRAVGTSVPSVAPRVERLATWADEALT
jgi:hypothetical protein